MKSTIKYLAIVALACLSLVSCKMNEAEAPISAETHFILNATSPKTKTGIIYDDGSYLPYFQNGDEIGLFVNALPTKTADMSTDAVFANSASDGTDAQFEGTLEVDPGSVTFYSFYPASAGKKVYVNNETVTLGLDVPSTQHPAYDAGMESYTFDPKADILIAKPATTTVDASHNAAAADIYFARLTAVLRVAVKAESNSSDVYGERIKSIKIETSAGNIAGRIVVNPLTGECTGVNEVGGSKAIEAVIDDPDDCSVYVGYEGSNIVFMGVAPVSIPSGSDLTFTINTIDATGKASHKIVKTVQDIENAIAFESSKPTVINLTVYNSEIGDPDEEDTTDYTGEWVIAGTQTNDYILSQFVSGNVYPAVEATSIDAENEIVTVVGSKTPYKLTIAKEAEGTYAGLYTIKDAGNKYLTASATSASGQNYLTGVETPVAGSYWNISKTEGVLDIIAANVDESYAREIRVNHNSGNNPRFSCYKASSPQPKVGLYPYSKVVEALEPAATPVISCDNNTITITCETSGASIYYTLGTTAENTANPTAESTLYDADNKPTITADAYIKAIAVADGFENSEIAAQTLTYVDASTIYYVKVTEAPTDWSGDYLIVYDNGNSSKVLTGVSGSIGQQADVIITNSKIVASDYSDYNIVIAAGSTSGKYTMKLGNSYLAYTSTATSGSNNLYTVSSATDNGSQWTLSVDDAQNVYNDKRYLRYNTGSPRFCCYVSGQQHISFYKLEDNRPFAPISWPNATETVTKNGSTITWGNGSAPVLTNAEGLAVTYSAVPESVATITPAGAISIVGAGTATIKASYTGAAYKDTEATFTLTVIDATPYTIACNSNDDSFGTVTPSATTATVGSTVTLTIAANEGYKLKSISATDASSNAVSLTSVDDTHRTFEMPASNVTVNVVFEDNNTTSTYVDILNNSNTINATTSSYSDWSVASTSTNSGAAYSGQSAGSYSSIQLRSNSNNSGVVTTTSGGKVKKIVVTWESNTASGRTLNIYGNNSAYSAATDLYDSSKQGTLLGTIVYGTSTELEISGDYAFIGFRSASGAMYLSEVKITWEN